VVGEGAAMQAQLITRVGETQYQTVGLFETSIPALINAPQAARFTF
jgi:protein-L-isoaspartate(D-aspartate) O-methyltransferase